MPGMFWYWLSDNVTADGIRADLQAMHDAGIGLVMLFSIGGLSMERIITPSAASLTPYWWDLIKLAVSECGRLGMRMLMNDCDGWATSGGPWISPELSMQKLVWSETVADAGKPVGLVQPETNHDYYRDLRVVAMPRPASWNVSSATVRPSVGGTLAISDVDRLLDPANDSATVESAMAGTLVFTFAKPFLLRAVTIRTPVPPKSAGAPVTPMPVRAAHEMTVEASDDGTTWRALGHLDFPRHGWQTPLDHLTHAVPETRARMFRLTYTPRALSHFREDMQLGADPRLALASILLSGRPAIHHLPIKSAQTWGQSRRMTAADLPDSACVPASAILDLTERMRPDGSLDWTPPKGQWTVLRIGHTSTDADNHPVTKNGHGLECDKFNPVAAELQFDSWFGKALAHVGPDLAGKVLHVFHVDSWEAKSQNWSPTFAPAFVRLRGYDLLSLLPVMAGIPIDSVDRSERVLFDVRRTVADCVSESFYGTLKAKCEANGCLFSGEVSNPTMPTDGLVYGRSVDVPMGEFWHRTPQNYKPSDINDAVSAAHIYGRKIAGAEAFTNFAIEWDETPWTLKALGDHHYALGINRFFLHVNAHQPWTDRAPGMTLSGIGTFFSRTQTWWKPGKAWFEYLARSQAVLQQGVAVVNIAMFIGEDIPARAVLVEDLPVPLPAGYRYGSINRDALMRLATVRDRTLVLPGGASYHVLILPRGTRMTPELAERIADFTEAGLLVIGTQPTASPSAGAMAVSDRRVRAASMRMGLVSYEAAEALGALLAGRGVAADVLLTAADSGVEWTHRQGSGWDLYFFSNQSDDARTIRPTVRAKGSVQLWHADTGARIAHIGEAVGNGTRLRIELAPRGSVFVILARGTKDDPIVSIEPDGAALLLGAVDTPAVLASTGGNWTVRRLSGVAQAIRVPDLPEAVAIDGPWRIAFGDGPTRHWSTLTSWSDDPDVRIRFFSGTARYSTSFIVPAGTDTGRLRWLLDLGGVSEMAAVRLNGRELGVVWKPPFRIDITDAVRKRRNLVEIAVTNTWKNRLIGDAGKLPVERETFVFPDRRFGQPWQPKSSDGLLRAGLFGPVMIVPQRAIRL